MIVITGGAGFIGSAILWGLNRRYRTDILIVDSFKDTQDNKWKNLVGHKFQDYMDKDEFINELESGNLTGKIDGIIHMGACTDTTETNAKFIIENNFTYSKRLALWAYSHGARFLYASSGATYGDGAKGFSDSLDILPHLHPLNIYGLSKHMFDMWALQNKLLDKIVGVKFFNVFGPNEYHKGEMRSVVHKTFEQIRNTKSATLFKSYNLNFPDGGQIRDFIYIKDVVDITLFLFSREDLSGIFNVGTGKGRTFWDLASAVFNAMRYEVNIQFIEMPETLRDKYQYFTQADITKLRKVGYTKPITELEDAVADYVKNYLLTDNIYLK